MRTFFLVIAFVSQISTSHAWIDLDAMGIAGASEAIQEYRKNPFLCGLVRNTDGYLAGVYARKDGWIVSIPQLSATQWKTRADAAAWLAQMELTRYCGERAFE